MVVFLIDMALSSGKLKAFIEKGIAGLHQAKDLENFTRILVHRTNLVVSTLDIDGKRLPSISCLSLSDIISTLADVHRSAADTLLRLNPDSDTLQRFKDHEAIVLNIFDAIDLCLSRSRESLYLLEAAIGRALKAVAEKLREFEKAGRALTEEFTINLRSIWEKQLIELRELNEKKGQHTDVVFGLSCMCSIITIVLLWLMAPEGAAAKSMEATEDADAMVMIDKISKQLYDGSGGGHERISLAIYELDDLKVLGQKLEFYMREEEKETDPDLQEEDKESVKEAVAEMRKKKMALAAKIDRLKRELEQSRKNILESDAKISQQPIACSPSDSPN